MFNNGLIFFSTLVIIGTIAVPVYLIDINAADGKLTVNKEVKNGCVTITLPDGTPGRMCSGETRPNDFQMEVYGFINNTYVPISTFPGDEIGWIVTIPGNTQYDVEEIKPFAERYWQLTEVGDCRGIMLENENKICTFINTFAVPPPTFEFNIGKNSTSP